MLPYEPQAGLQDAADRRTLHACTMIVLRHGLRNTFSGRTVIFFFWSFDYDRYVLRLILSDHTDFFKPHDNAKSSTRTRPHPIPAAAHPAHTRFGFHESAVTWVSSSKIVITAVPLISLGSPTRLRSKLVCSAR